MKQKSKFLVCFLMALFALASCGYDDSSIWESINNLESRVDNIENQLTEINKNVASLQALVDAQKQQVSITNIKETSTGYTLVFSDGSEININNGQDGMTPYIGSNGNWWIGTTDTGVHAAAVDGKDGEDGLTPYVGSNGNWWIGSSDTGVKAAANQDLTPYIGANGNWWLGNTDTGVRAAAIDGKDGNDGLTPYIGTNGHWWIGNTDTGIAAHIDSTSSEYPIITVIQQNNHYYWAQVINGNLTILVDTNGNYIEVGSTNQTPRIKVDSYGYWMISYDAGVTWVYIFDEHGNKFTAGNSGNHQCNCGIKSVQVTSTSVYITLYDGTVLVFDYEGGYTDPRYEDVVPKDIRDKMGKYMDIYNGINPPNIEGSFTIDPMVALYCEDYGHGGFEPGYVVSSEDIRFSNQNSKDNSISYEEHSVNSNSYESARGAFISGSGNNFTVFFNTEGYSSGVKVKTALLISGTKTSSGIANLRFAFVMVDDGGDPNGNLMEVGVFRIFRDQDELTVPKTWQWGNLLQSNRRALSPVTNTRFFELCSTVND